MNDFERRAFFKITLISTVATFFALSFLGFFADIVHPRLACRPIEKKYAEQIPQPFEFNVMSGLFWGSLCASDVKPLFITASEGEEDLKFSSILKDRGIAVNEIAGAHRGIKSLSYLLSTPLHPDRDHLKIIGLINPVYFGFAADTDSASMRLSASSPLTYFFRLPHWKYDYNELLLSSFYIGGKTYFENLFLLSHPEVLETIEDKTDLKEAEKIPRDYNLALNLYTNRTPGPNHFYYKTKLEMNRGAVPMMLGKIKKYLRERPSSSVCVVLLPMNERPWRVYGRQDIDSMSQALHEAFADIPPEHFIDLSSWGNKDYLFLDVMHLSDYGKVILTDELLKSPCVQKVFGTNP